jgi:hypothetical protein
VSQVCEEIASGLISHEMKHNIKKEFDDELKYYKGLVNQSYNTLMIPMVAEVTTLVTSVLKA